MNIYDIINRARSLREEYRLDSVTPERLGALHEDTLTYINQYQLLASSPAIHKTFVSVSAMQGSASPTSDLTGRPLKAGQLVVIVPSDQTDSTAGDVYRYDGPSGSTSKWTFVAKLGAVPADSELSATSTNPPQNRAVTEKLTELESETRDYPILKRQYNSSAVSDILWDKTYTDTVGTIADADGFFITPKIVCKYNDVLTISAGGIGVYFIVYDTEGNSINSYGINSNPRTFTLSSAANKNAAYCRCAFYKDVVGSYIDINNIRVFEYTQTINDFFVSVQDFREKYAEMSVVRRISINGNELSINAGQYVYMFDDHYGNRVYVNVAEDTTYSFESGEVLVLDKASSSFVKQEKKSTTDNQVILVAYDAAEGFTFSGAWGNHVVYHKLLHEIEKSNAAIARNTSDIADINFNVGDYNSSAVSDILWDKTYTDTVGTIADADGFFITPKIVCKYNDVLTISAGGIGVYFIVYDTEGNSINSYGINSNPRTFTLSSAANKNAAYCRCAFYKDVVGSYIDINNIRVFEYTQNLHGLLVAMDNSDKLPSLVAADNAIIELTEKVANAVDGKDILFVHITDTHAGAASIPLKVSTEHMNRACFIASKINSNFLVHTGDAIHGYDNSAASAKDSWRALLDSMNIYTIPFLYAEGNRSHDMGYQDEINREQIQTFAGRLSRWVGSNAIYNQSDINSYFYADIEQAGCRVFILDSQDYGIDRLTYGFSTQQVDFVTAALADALSKNIPVVFFAHMPPVAELFEKGYDYGMGINGAAMASAIGQFTSNGGVVLGYIYGHMHWDNYYYDEINKIPFICAANDYAQVATIDNPPQWGIPSVPVRDSSGLTQYAMDAYVLNVNTGKIQIFRYGAGVDRCVNVNINRVAVGGTIAIPTQLIGIITWYIHDKSVAAIAEGVVTGVSTGNTWVSATDTEGNVEYYRLIVE